MLSCLTSCLGMLSAVACKQGVLRLVGGVLQSAYLGLDRLLRKGLHDNMNTFITVCADLVSCAWAHHYMQRDYLGNQPIELCIDRLEGSVEGSVESAALLR